MNKLGKGKNTQKKLEPVTEIRESKQTPNQPPLNAMPKISENTNFKKKEDPNVTERAHEVTGNSFFDDVTLNLKKDKKKLASLGQKPMIAKPKNPDMIKIPEEKAPDSHMKGFNVYQMEDAKPNPEVEKKNNESMLGTKIKRENVTKDLNCTINDESILEYLIDENGYLMTEKGDLIYDNDGQVVKLSDDQIEKFKENEAYEEIEY
jgi:hypothetical protein